MDKLDSSCPMVGPAPVEKERSDRHSQGSIIHYLFLDKKSLEGGWPFHSPAAKPTHFHSGMGRLTNPLKASVPIFSLQDLLWWKQQQLW